jgi:hypothetical protein
LRNLCRHRGAEGVGAGEFRGSLLVEDVEFLDGEGRRRQQVDDGPGEVASAGDPLLQRVEAPLPAADPLIGGQPVLEEVQPTPGLENPPQGIGPWVCRRANHPGLRQPQTALLRASRRALGGNARPAVTEAGLTTLFMTSPAGRRRLARRWTASEMVMRRRRD